jgi:hypothetical protein
LVIRSLTDDLFHWEMSPPNALLATFFQIKTDSASALLSPTGAKERTEKLLPIVVVVVVMTSTKENIEKVKVLQDINLLI